MRRIRVRAAMAAHAAIDGRFLGGQPPFGYHLADAGPHPSPAKARLRQRAHRLAVDSGNAAVVRRIYTEFLDGQTTSAIARRLTHDGVAVSHSAAATIGTSWSRSTVRGILTNPRYTGRQVWNRIHREDVLVDVDQVALGHRTGIRRTRPRTGCGPGQPRIPRSLT